MFYMQDTGNPRFDMARNAAGRRQDTSDSLRPDLTWASPFRGQGTSNPCNVAPPLVCISSHYVLGNNYDRKTPYMVQYLVNIQRELGHNTALEVGYLGSQSKRLERMFDGNETVPANPAVDSRSVQLRKPYPEFSKIQEIGNVAEAKYNSLAVKVTRRLNNGLSVHACARLFSGGVSGGPSPLVSGVTAHLRPAPGRGWLVQHSRSACGRLPARGTHRR